MAHNIDRRGFLRSSLLLAGGLVVGEEAIDALALLTHTRKSFPSAGFVTLPIPALPIYELPPNLRAGNRSPKWGGVIFTHTITHIEPEWLRYGA